MSREVWKSWIGHQECSARLVRPRTLEALCDAVREATARGDRIRAAGNGYSWSPLVPVDGTVIEMRELRRITRFEPRPETGPPWVEVECGATIGELDQFVRSQPGGFTLISPTMFPRPTVGGALATGSHGVGSGSGNFSDGILEMTLVRADGSVHTLSRGDADFPAAQVALGTLGIVHSIKLEIRPQYNVYVDQRPVPIRYVVGELDDLCASCECVEILWFPGTNKMQLYMMNPTRSHEDPPEVLARLVQDLELRIRQWGAGFIAFVARHAPRFTPHANRFGARLIYKTSESVKTASDAFHFVKTYPKNWDLSYAVPADRADRAWRELVDLIEEYDRAELYPINLAAHCRFVGPSEAWLAPNYRQPACFIEVSTSSATPEWQQFFEEVECRWAAIDGARPHWAKLHGGGPVFGRKPPLFGPWLEVKELYPRMDDFLAVRERWDPKRVFLNPYLEERVFGLPPADVALPPPTAPDLRATPRPSPGR